MTSWRIEPLVRHHERAAFSCGQSVQGQGLGAFLLLDALARSERLAKDLGLHAVELQAIDDTARAFYLHHGVEALQDDPQHLYLPMKAIRLLRLNEVTK